MGKFRGKQRTKYTKKRRGFCGKKKDVYSELNVNNELNVNTELNVNSELKINNSTDTSVAATSSTNMTTTSMIDLTKSSVSSQKVSVFAASTPKEKDKISGNRIIDTSILSDVFKLVLCPRCSISTISLSDKVS